MSATFVNNRFCVAHGDPAFYVMSNWCDFFSLGEADGDDVWLEGKLVDGEFVFNGRLFMHDGSGGTVIDSFPKANLPDGWSQKRRLDVEGYELRDPRGDLVFSYWVEENTCHVELDLFTKSGDLAAHGGQGGMVVHVPAQLGTNGLKVAPSPRPGEPTRLDPV